MASNLIYATAETYPKYIRDSFVVHGEDQIWTFRLKNVSPGGAKITRDNHLEIESSNLAKFRQAKLQLDRS